jgi:hypothetical protein
VITLSTEGLDSTQPIVKLKSPVYQAAHRLKLEVDSTSKPIPAISTPFTIHIIVRRLALTFTSDFWNII